MNVLSPAAKWDSKGCLLFEGKHQRYIDLDDRGEIEELKNSALSQPLRRAHSLLAEDGKLQTTSRRLGTRPSPTPTREPLTFSSSRSGLSLAAPAMVLRTAQPRPTPACPGRKEGEGQRGRCPPLPARSAREEPKVLSLLSALGGRHSPRGLRVPFRPAVPSHAPSLCPER